MKFLKRIILLLAVTATVASCTKDDDDAKVSGNKYETTYAKITVSIDGSDQTAVFDTVEELKENELYLKIDFRSDNTFWVYEEIDDNGTYAWMQGGTWSQKNSKITITSDDETFTATVDGSKLVMIIDFDDESGKKLSIATSNSRTIEWHFSKI